MKPQRRREREPGRERRPHRPKPREPSPPRPSFLRRVLARLTRPSLPTAWRRFRWMILCRSLLILAVLSVVLFVVMLLLSLPRGLVVLGLLAVWVAATRKRKKVLDYFGTSRFADGRDLADAGLLENKGGLCVGVADIGRQRWKEAMTAPFDPRLMSEEACRRFTYTSARAKSRSASVFLNDGPHHLVAAKTGAGKTSGLVVPHLLNCNDSMIVLDYKGELYKLTAEHRKKMGHEVFVLDPMKLVTQNPHTLNVLEFIDKDDPTAMDQIMALAQSLVVRTGQEREPHFLDSAENWLTATIAAYVAFHECPSLQDVRDATADPEELEAAVGMLKSSSEWNGALARLGHSIEQYVDRERGSVQTTVTRMVRWLDSPYVYENTVGKSSFNPRTLTEKKVTVYCVVPLDKSRTLAPLLRVWLTSMLWAVLRNGLQERNKTWFICDEASVLGGLEPVLDALKIGRSFGLRMLLLYQDMGEIAECWPGGKMQTVLGNCSQTYMNCQDLETAKQISDRLGDWTQAVESSSWSWGSSGSENSDRAGGNTGWNRGGSSNTQPQAKRLLSVSDVLNLNPRIAITFHPGCRPIASYPRRWYEQTPQKAGYWRQLWGRADVWLVTALMLFATSFPGVWAARRLMSYADPKPVRPAGVRSYDPRVKAGVGGNKADVETRGGRDRKGPLGSQQRLRGRDAAERPAAGSKPEDYEPAPAKPGP